MKTKRALRLFGKAVLVLAFIAGLLLLSTDIIKSRIRRNVADEAIEAVESMVDEGGGTLIFKLPVSDFLRINGENGQDDSSLQDLIREMGEISAGHEELTLLGILEIPCIDVKEPIWDSCTSTALRFGVGRFPQTCNIGENGNCTLFGHRMESHTIFWQLQSLENHIGEEVIVTTTDGIRHEYRIEDTVYAIDSEIDPYLRADTYDTEHLCLATCGYGQDPNNKEIYRPKNTEFIVICVPRN